MTDWISRLSDKTIAEPPAGTAQLDPDVRRHHAAHDPEFPAKRERAVQILRDAVGRVAEAQGFITKPASWSKAGPLGLVSLHLQRSAYGFDCTINLGWQPHDAVAQGIWAQQDHVPLGHFYPDSGGTHDTPAGTIIYLDVIEDENALSEAMQVLSERALPWLLRHLIETPPPDAP